MLVAVGLQIIAVVILSLIAYWVSGLQSAGSLFAGGLAAFLPNALFALRLTLQRGGSPESYPVVFFLGEFIKIGLTIGLLGALVKWGGPLHWPSLILGFIVSLKMPLFAIWVTGDKSPAPLPETTEETKANTEQAQAKTG